MAVKNRFLSHVLMPSTPTYGNRSHFSLVRNSDISQGAVANDSSFCSTVHIGTHIDMPLHFFESGQSIEDFSAGDFIFEDPLCLDVTPSSLVIYDELICQLDTLGDKDRYDILIVRTGIERFRGEEKFWGENPGFSPELAGYLRGAFPSVRVLGFDSISVSSFAHRMVGRKAHQEFLNPSHPILLLEDMHLLDVPLNSIQKIIVAPMRIAACDGLPCTVIAELKD